MGHYEIRFDAEHPDIDSFGLFVQKSLVLHQLDRHHTVEYIIGQAYKRCETTGSADSVVQIHLAWLKTVCLEVILELRRTNNRRKFDEAVRALFDNQNPDSLSFCAGVTRTLRQLRLGGTYEAKDVISEAYTRGVKQIESGKLIDIPLAWLRGTCLNVASELKRKQLKLDNPKFDREACVTEDITISEIVLQEDLRALQLALKQLSVEEQKLLHTRIFQGLDWREIGESISNSSRPPLSPGTARQRGSRALQKLRKLYYSIREEVRLADTDPS